MTGVILITGGILLLLGILWGPTLILIRFSNIKVGSKKLLLLLLSELALVIFLVFIADLAGLKNPGGIFIASTILVSLLGVFVAKNAIDSCE